MRREDILNQNNFYKLAYTTDHDAPPKLLEDELVYEKYRNWEKIGWLLDNPPTAQIILTLSREPSTTKFEVRGETIERWYAILAKYFEKKPDEKTMRAFLFKQRKLRGQTNEIIDAVKKLRENKKAVDILGKISDEILP
jgi:hypothetical protein